MKATIQEDPSQTVVLVIDDVVTENVEEFKRIIDEVLERRSGFPLVLDLAHIDYLCSAGVGVIAGAHRILKDNAAELIIANPSERVARLFMVTRLDTVLRIVGARRAAPGQAR